jgi:hypothetical protein
MPAVIIAAMRGSAAACSQLRRIAASTNFGSAPARRPAQALRSTAASASNAAAVQPSPRTSWKEGSPSRASFFSCLAMFFSVECFGHGPAARASAMSSA